MMNPKEQFIVNLCLKRILCVLALLLATIIYPVFVEGSGVPSIGDNEVMVGYACIEIPIDRILLVKKDNVCFAIKFKKNWELNSGAEKYALYESYVLGSKGHRSENIEKYEGIASSLPLKGPFRPFIYQPGNSFVKFGRLRLTWEWKRKVCFFPPDKGRGDFGYELSPTKWMDVLDIDLSDPRITWYRFEEGRERKIIKIDDLW